MVKDKYSAVWVSNTSIRNFLECPRAYYLKNVYRDPQTNNKIKIINPPLAMGQVVHEVLESLSKLPVNKRFQESLQGKLDKAWKKIAGEKGGFPNKEVEQEYKKKARGMISKVTQTPGPLKRLAVKIQMDLPHYWLSKEKGIILCGKIDWLEYLPEKDAVHIIDFKTGKKNNKSDDRQLAIYQLLVSNTQKRPVEKASFWYLKDHNVPTPKKLPDLDESKKEILEIAQKIKLARQLQRFKCPQGEKGCFACRPLERVIKGEGKLVGTDEYDNNVYILPKTKTKKDQPQSIIH